LEKNEWSRPVPPDGWHFEWTFGFCQRPNAWARMMGVNATTTINKRQYVPLKIPTS
jgi:hypothetical protein